MALPAVVGAPSGVMVSPLPPLAPGQEHWQTQWQPVVGSHVGGMPTEDEDEMLVVELDEQQELLELDDEEQCELDELQDEEQHELELDDDELGEELLEGNDDENDELDIGKFLWRKMAVDGR